MISYRRASRPLALLLTLTTLLSFSAPAYSERLRDLASFAGVRNNALVGYGLVVGLDGTGDQTMQTPFTGQSLENMLSQLGTDVPEGTNMQVRNVASVMVTAELPPFSQQGQELDVVVSSVGNARSLRGGTLLMTPLKGADGEIYAMAQGNLHVGGASAEAAGSSVEINQQAGGRINGGATVEREVPLQMAAEDGTMELELNEADFGTARDVVEAINGEFDSTVASAVNSRVIRLRAPMTENERVNFLARVENLDVDPGEGPAKVVVNSRTGSVVLSSAVSLHRAAVAHGNLSVTISQRFNASQPNPFGEGETVVTPEADINIEQQEAPLQYMDDSADLVDVVNALNTLGATPQDLISILQALKAAGSLRAELEII
ncbi:flagellar basal body P-ring protein FlgI [Aidingimonas halophila]|uniref:Flagellar P-ring protein n=1 Tax=Aidingimonas halophila TaxID=574349 RepID=A0A1H3B9S9_9GAMM|nr:flagellar basal body P-ring protein FlgI [Aidingimonas halophila]GHC26082.1 flagellar P-ring protein [Aidingimonas halophila]SDX38164.1 flagellar P-ring protein precursor FlgI [Aidingimonas halophila]